MTEHPDPPRLADLAREMPPPAELEGRVVAALAERGLLRPSRFRRARTGLALAAAAALAAFVAGGLVGRLSSRPSPPPAAGDGRPTFALFLFEDAAFDVATGEAGRERVAEYVAWGRGLSAVGGRTVGGAKLALEVPGVLLDGVAAGVPAVSAPPDPALGTMAGFFLVEAASLDEAVALARGCPHLRYGGRIVVREVEGVGR